MVTSVRSSTSKRLKLIGWRLFNTGGFTRIGDSGNQVGEVGELAAQPSLETNFLATAVRSNTTNRLKLIGWRILSVNGDLQFNRLGDSGDAAGEVARLDLTVGNLDVDVPANTFFSAVQTRAKRLKIIAWTTEEDAGSFTRVGDSGTLGGEVDELWTEYQPFFGVATAEQMSNDDHLRVSWWGVSGNNPEEAGSNLEFVRFADSGNQAGAIRSVTGMVVDSNNAFTTLLTAVRTKSESRLKLISWRLNN